MVLLAHKFALLISSCFGPHPLVDSFMKFRKSHTARCQKPFYTTIRDMQIV